MAIAPGEKLGPYEIIASIGKGGMGEVYKSRDTRLGREVAVKVSGERFSERFEREARAIAALNHPNICHLYDVGPNYLVMELVDGPTLGEKLKEGAIPFEEAIGIARQIADAVEAAHEKGIIHRDLKPGNVKIKPDGTVKVLDFGLAKVGGAPAVAASDESPTLSMHETKAGVILGTAAYMSPEQAKGKDVDKRADIWAFGVVLYEMLTGKKLFEGESLSDLLAAVIKEQPDLSAAPASTWRLLRRCLEKDPKNRLRDIGDAGVELREIVQAHAKETPIAHGAPAKHSMPRWMWGVVGLLAAAVAAAAAWELLKPKADEPLLQTEITAPEGAKFVASITPFALSPDGRKLVFLAVNKDGKRMLWLRPIDSASATELAGTEGAEVPFWSPDSRWVGFSANGKLQKIDVVGGGQPQVICNIDGRAGGTWNKDGVILFDQGAKPLQKVSAAGGTPVDVFPLDKSRGEATHLAPFFLPDGQHFLYYSSGKQVDSKFASLDGKVNRVILERQGVPTFAPNPRGGGWLVYNVRGQLQARPFDPEKGEFLGQPSMVADGVTPGRWWSASTNGILAFRHNYGTQFQLSWVGRDGKPLGTLGDPGVIADPAISPDQKSIVFDRSNDNNVDLWTFDLARNNAARFTFEPGVDIHASWSPDGKNIIYASQRNTSWFVVERPANGVGQEAVLESNVGDRWVPASESRDGKWLAVIEASPVHSVILLRSRDEPKKTVHIQEHESERDASFSPDGRWLLYSSVPSSIREVLVQSVPKEAGGSATAVGKWQISTGGGSQPVWRADGKEIFYVARDGMMTAVPVESGPDLFRPGTPKSLFQTRLEFDEMRNGASSGRQYDVTSDGQKFLLNQHVTNAADAPINIVVNWPKLLAK